MKNITIAELSLLANLPEDFLRTELEIADYILDISEDELKDKLTKLNKNIFEDNHLD